jgi:hypothetical protein
MNKAVSDCLTKQQYTKKDCKNFPLRIKLYKCSMCGYYHVTSKGVKRER